MQRISITLEDEDLQEIKDYCSEKDVKVSALLRRSALNKIRKGLAENE
jgi:hypothetical protein